VAAQLRLIRDLQDKVPENIDIFALKHKLKGDDNPLNVVLVQEIMRYNVLLADLRKDLDLVERGIQGLVAISPELELVMLSLNDNKVPVAWAYAYFSLKPLANWF
jgi:dynein heavy chain